MASKAFLLSTFLTAFLTARSCGLIPSGQGRTIIFNLTNFILPAAMAFTQEMGASAIAPTISKTEEESKAFVQRVLKQLVCEEKMDNCHVVKDTISEICNPSKKNECDMPDNVKPVRTEHMSISGRITTTNIIMANWSKEMWQVVLSRVLRSLKSGSLATSFYRALITVN